MSVVLHIGLHKTGTTSLQSWLRDHPDELAKVNARFPYGWLQLNNHFEFSLALLRTERLTPARSRGVEWMWKQWRHNVIAQLVSDLAGHPDETTIYSCEELSLFRYDDEFEQLRRIVGEAHVVLYLRELQSWLESVRTQLEVDRERLDRWNPHGIDALSDDRDAYNCVSSGAWIRDHIARFDSWTHWFKRVSVFDYDVATSLDGSVIPSFCRLLGIKPSDYERYWQNKRGTSHEGRVPGTRWSGGRFGVEGNVPVDEAAVDRYLANEAARTG